MERIQQVSNQLTQNKTSGILHRTNTVVGKKNPDDVVICGAYRSPMCKNRRGGLKDTPSERLIGDVLKGLIERTGVNPKDIQDITLGNVLQSGSGFMVGRMGQFLAGIPYTASLSTTNRLCSSGLEACATVATKIQSGILDIGVAGGFENMSQFQMEALVPVDNLHEDVFENENARDCMMSMGVTSENVASDYGITRDECDKFGLGSMNKALNAQKSGYFNEEIIPIKTQVKSTDKDGNESTKDVTLTQDEGFRQTNLEKLGKLKPSFKKDGVSTAGNSSQTTDGAAVVLIARRSTAEKLGLPIRAKWVTYATAGVPPRVMGIGPAFAIPKALDQAGLKVSDVGVYELNEAFATQAIYCAKKLNIPEDRINPKGGAIACGHPLGCTGARIMATLLPELKRQNQKLGVISMCIGTGMGAAAVIENEQ